MSVCICGTPTIPYIICPNGTTAFGDIEKVWLLKPCWFIGVGFEQTTINAKWFENEGSQYKSSDGVNGLLCFHCRLEWELNKLPLLSNKVIQNWPNWPEIKTYFPAEKQLTVGKLPNIKLMEKVILNTYEYILFMLSHMHKLTISLIRYNTKRLFHFIFY